MALKYIHKKSRSEKVTAKEISEALRGPFDVIARVLQTLAQRDVLTSEQGASGGYRLHRDLREISLFELFEMIEGPTALVKCLSEDGGCDIQNQCNIISPLKNLNHRLQVFFQKISIAELVEEKLNLSDVGSVQTIETFEEPSHV